MSKISIKNPFPMSIKKTLLISGITIIVGTVIVIILAVISSVQSIPPKDFYELAGNRIPAYESIVGKREGVKWIEDKEELKYVYRRSPTSADDAKTYVQYLCENHGFQVDKEIPGAIAFSKSAAQESEAIRMVIQFSADQDVGVQMKLFDLADVP